MGVLMLRFEDSGLKATRPRCGCRSIGKRFWSLEHTASFCVSGSCARHNSWWTISVPRWAGPRSPVWWCWPIQHKGIKIHFSIRPQRLQSQTEWPSMSNQSAERSHAFWFRCMFVSFHSSLICCELFATLKKACGAFGETCKPYFSISCLCVSLLPLPLINGWCWDRLTSHITESAETRTCLVQESLPIIRSPDLFPKIFKILSRPLWNTTFYVSNSEAPNTFREQILNKRHVPKLGGGSKLPHPHFRRRQLRNHPKVAAENRGKCRSLSQSPQHLKLWNHPKDGLGKQWKCQTWLRSFPNLKLRNQHVTAVRN